MAWIELEAKQDNFKVWNWNFSLINFLLSDKGESWKGDLDNLRELVQTLLANSIFLGQAEVKSQMESFFFFFFSFCLWILATALLAWTTLCLLSGILEAGCPHVSNSCWKKKKKKRNKPLTPASESKYFCATVSLFKRSIWSWKALPYTSGPKNCQKNIFFSSEQKL